MVSHGLLDRAAEIPEFVANQLMFSFGTKGVVQDRLTSLITSLSEYIPTDNTCYLFARFCKLLVRCSLVQLGRLWSEF